MAKRIPLTKKVRFEVFKRDNFTCQYCGAKAPDIILHADHIKPVSKGGGNEILNLITSCINCNLGKKDRELSDNSVISIQRSQLEELSERRQQIEMMMDWKTSLLDVQDDEIERCIQYFGRITNACMDLTDKGKKELRSLVKKYGYGEVINAIDTLFDKYSYLTPVEMWDKLKGVINYNNASPLDREIMYIKGILKNRYRDYIPYQADDILRAYNDMFGSINESVTGWAKGSRSFEEFYCILHNRIYP